MRSGTLKVVLDGAEMPDDEARAFWQRFSAYMDEHKGDLAGFAKSEGLASVHPEMRGGGPVLVASKTAAQRPYTNAPRKDPPRTGGGSPPDQRGGGAPRRPGGNRGNRGR